MFSKQLRPAMLSAYKIMRDDFSQKVADNLAKRVANHCSNPNCRKKTSGPHTEVEKALNVGVAAHITAASPGGPRYDSMLTPAQRKSGENGIWLCQSCAKLIDNDPALFPTELGLFPKSGDLPPSPNPLFSGLFTGGQETFLAI